MAYDVSRRRQKSQDVAKAVALHLRKIPRIVLCQRSKRRRTSSCKVTLTKWPCSREDEPHKTPSSQAQSKTRASFAGFHSWLSCCCPILPLTRSCICQTQERRSPPGLAGPACLVVTGRHNGHTNPRMIGTSNDPIAPCGCYLLARAACLGIPTSC